jgi:hypothetical protein
MSGDPAQVEFGLPLPCPCQWFHVTVQATLAGALWPAVASWKSILPSLNDVVAVPDTGPVALTEYRATNQSGRVNWSERVPSPSAVTSTSRRQVWPASSLTTMRTVSPGTQPCPASVTVPPGA